MRPCFLISTRNSPSRSRLGPVFTELQRVTDESYMA